MTQTPNKQADTADILIPDGGKKIVYGGREVELKPLNIGKILAILRIVQRSEKQVKAKLKAMFDERKSQLQKDNKDGVVLDREVEMTYLDIALAVVEVINDGGDLYTLIATILEITEKEATDGFKLSSLMEIVTTVLENEEMEKLFLELTKLSNKMNGLGAK